MGMFCASAARAKPDATRIMPHTASRRGPKRSASDPLMALTRKLKPRLSPITKSASARSMPRLAAISAEKAELE